jgi:hypothetical protein
VAPRRTGALVCAFAFACATAAVGGPEPTRGRPARALDVPFVAQPPELCGGAAASMVLRYWGARDAHASDFAALVRPEAGGIPAPQLVQALRERGLEARSFEGDARSAREHLARGRPLIALVHPPGGPGHYVVVVGWEGERVLVHDPADGPFRVWPAVEFDTAWSRAGRWTLLAVPGAQPKPGTLAESRSTSSPASSSDCGGLVPAAVEQARLGHLEDAAASLERAVRLCPRDSAPWRELAGVRFRQERYREAAAHAAEAVARDGDDALAWRILATGRFLAGDETGALAAWNRLGEPTLDLVTLEGADRTREAVLSERLGLRPRSLLDPDDLRRAARRLEAVPSVRAARVAYRPLEGGRAEVTAALVERPLVPSWRSLGLRGGIDAAVRRETRLALASVTRDGGLLSLGWRWRPGNPAASLALAAPGGLRLPGVVRLEGLLDTQLYAGEGGAFQEHRRRATLGFEEWWTADLRAGVTGGVELGEDGDFALLGAHAERRLASDRLAVLARVERGLGSGRGFTRGEVRVLARSTPRASDRLVVSGRLGYTGASAGAPRFHWPGAGTGSGRDLLLRAHPLLVDDVVAGEAFGRRLLDAGVEAELRLAGLGPASFGLAAFADAARAWERPQPAGAGPLLVDVGVGARASVPGLGRVRLDLATRVGGGGLTLSAGWLPPWPR